MLSRDTLLLLCSLVCLITLVRSRHVHHRPQHRHLHRAETPQATSTAPVLQSSEASPTDSNYFSVIQDVAAIEGGLSALPEDLLRLIEGLNQKLQSLETMLEGLAASSTDTAPSSLTTTAATASIASEVSALDTSTGQLTSTSAQPVSYGAADSSHVQYTAAPHHTSYHTSTTTVFSTLNSTITKYTTLSTASAGTLSPQYANRTAYIFRPDASDNVAVYYGQTANTTAEGLAKICQGPNVDIVILAFVNDFFSAGGYPAVNFGPACDPPTEAQRKKAPGLLNCPRLASQIKRCQQIGKPVLVSLGGYIANTAFASDEQASQFATTLWNLFGGGTQTPHLRPFGHVKVDGFDIDNENHITTYYDTFATALRKQFAKDKRKRYYLSAAPQCVFPDESIPMGALQQADWWMVQYYNNPQCDYNSPGFAASFGDWANHLHNTNTPRKPKLYIGAGAFEGAGSGYVPGAQLRSRVDLVRSHSNLGGMMLWDGTAGMDNVDERGRTYIQYAKAALQS